MGNHDAGHAMELSARMWWKGRGNSKSPTKDEALTVLDDICDAYRGCDAEFEGTDPRRVDSVNPDYDYSTDPEGPIGKLIAIAFDAQPNEMALEDCDDCPWHDGPEKRFRKRYDFC